MLFPSLSTTTIARKDAFSAFFEIYKIYTPPLGRKKRQSLFSPKKNLLARAKQFMFEVGAKIDFWHVYVQSRSQNRSVTILNLYMGGGRLLTPFPHSTPVSTHARVYPHLFDFFGNFRNSWKIYEPNKWKKCVSLLEFGAFLDFVAIVAPQQQKSENQKILYSPVGE